MQVFEIYLSVSKCMDTAKEAIQFNLLVTSDFVTSAFCVPTHKNPQRHKIIYCMRPTKRTIYQFEAFHLVMRIPLLKFSKIPLAFLVRISKPLSNFHSVLCVHNRFVTMHL